MGRPKLVRSKICPRCGVDFSPKDWRSTFCSYSCARTKDLPTKVCERCGDTFRKNPEYSYVVWGQVRFCSRKCGSGGRPAVMARCAFCDAEFVSRSRSGIRGPYCSLDCYHESLRVVVYPLRTRGSREFSKPMKRLLLEAAGGKCEWCGSTENLEFDHIVPRFLGGKGELSNGQVLCRACHHVKTLIQRPSGCHPL